MPFIWVITKFKYVDNKKCKIYFIANHTKSRCVHCALSIGIACPRYDCQDEKGSPDLLVNDEDCITIMLLLY